MNSNDKAERESEEIEVDVYEGEPDFKSSATENGNQDDGESNQEVPDA